MNASQGDRAVLAPVGLMPGVPELHPAVSGSRARLCRETTAACIELAERIVRARPARLLVVSAHARRHGGAFGLSAAGHLTGSLAGHGAPDVAVDLPVDAGLAVRLWATTAQRTVATWDRPAELDANTTAALAFLVDQGWSGPTTVLSLPLTTGTYELEACGRAVDQAASELGGRTAMLVVGEGCRRVRRGSPEDYHPEAILFDQRAGRALLAGRPSDLLAIDRALRNLALETLVEGCTLVLAALAEPAWRAQLTSYENALGVGHFVGLLHDDEG